MRFLWNRYAKLKGNLVKQGKKISYPAQQRKDNINLLDGGFFSLLKQINIKSEDCNVSSGAPGFKSLFRTETKAV